MAMALAIGLAPAAWASKTDDILLGIEDLQQQVLLLTREQARTNEAMTEVRRRLEGQSGTMQTLQADLLQKIDILLEEVQILRQKLEDTGSRLVSLTQELRRLQPGALPAPGPEGKADSPSTAETPATASPESAFQGAYADYSKGNFQLALWGFQDFMRKYPTDPRLSEALYWIAECHLSQGEHSQAMAQFDRLLQQYPNSPKAAGSHLKKGLTLLEANQVAQAVVQLQHVVQNYPHSNEARIAKERLRELGLR
ncbi:MAG: tol-pal system protein YbgF [Acidobacteriota bacterium]